MPIKCGLPKEERVGVCHGEEPNEECLGCFNCIIVPYDERFLEPERRENKISEHGGNEE